MNQIISISFYHERFIKHLVYDYIIYLSNEEFFLYYVTNIYTMMNFKLEINLLFNRIH